MYSNILSQTLLILFLSISLTAQDRHAIECSDPNSEEFILKYKEQIKNGLAQPKVLKNNSLVKLPVIVHFVGFDNPSSISEDLLAKFFSITNSYFQKINASYYLVDIRFINDFTFPDPFDFNVMFQYMDLTAYNLLIYDGSYGIGGSGGGDFILSHIGIGNMYYTDTYFRATNLHEIGHNYGLRHTFSGTDGGNSSPSAENVARTGPQANCDVAGDLLCDTPADPKPYSSDETDIYGVPYDPDKSNIMSYYPNRTTFTAQQYEVMTAGFIEELNKTSTIRLGVTYNYNLDGYVQTVIPDAPVLTSIESVSLGNKVSWSAAENSMGYYVERSEVSANSDFIPLTLSGVGPNKTEVIDRTADPNTTYWYRVISINSKDNYSNVLQFPLTNSCGSSASLFSGCGVTVQVSGLNVSLSAIDAPENIQIIKIRTPNWEFLPDDLCNTWISNINCSTGDMLSVPEPGIYFVNIQGSPNCEFEIQVDGSTNGVDNDGDGICAQEDCDDNNSSLPNSQVLLCDDGDPNTINDVIPIGECTCSGTPSCSVAIPAECSANIVCVTLNENVLSVNTNGNDIPTINIHLTDFSSYENLCGNWLGVAPCTGTLLSSDLPLGDFLLRVDDPTTSSGICWIPFTVVDSNIPALDNRCTDSPDLILSNGPLGDGIYSAPDKVISQSTIPSGSTVEFMAAEAVELLPEFNVSINATFEIVLDACL